MGGNDLLLDQEQLCETQAWELDTTHLVAGPHSIICGVWGSYLTSLRLLPHFSYSQYGDDNSYFRELLGGDWRNIFKVLTKGPARGKITSTL